MRVLGIDPGPERSAFVMWDGKEILDNGIEPNHLIIEILHSEVETEDRVACEHLQCFGMAVGREVFETAYWIGAFRQESRFLKFIRIYRSDVKMHLCHSMRATDSNIRQAVIDRFGAPGTKKAPGLTYGLKGDMWSAFAIAVTAFDKL